MLLAAGCTGGGTPGLVEGDNLGPVPDAGAGPPSLDGGVITDATQEGPALADAGPLTQQDAGANGDSGTVDGGTVDGEGIARDEDVAVNPGSDASMVDPSCTPLRTWGAPAPVPGVSSFASEPLVTMTGDELTLAWVVDAGAGAGNVFYADRALASDPFPAGQPLVASGGAGDAGTQYFAFDRVAVTGDGLTLTGLAIGGLNMADFTRTARGQAFSPSGLAYPFQPMVNQLTGGDFRGGSLSDPVVSADGHDLVYSVVGLPGSTSVYESTTTTQIWSMGEPQADPPLQIVQSARKRPTSLTADRLNLFHWDEGSNMAFIVQRGVPTAELNFSWALGPYFSVQTNATCSRLYYVSAAAGGGFELVSSDAVQ